MSDNPYQAPLDSQGPALNSGAPTGLALIARTRFLAWEKLRLVYLAVCGVTTLTAMLMFDIPLDEVLPWGMIVFGAVVSNVFYFCGPIAESFVAWMGFNSVPFRITTFIFGTLFTSVCAIVAVSQLDMI